MCSDNVFLKIKWKQQLSMLLFFLQLHEQMKESEGTTSQENCKIRETHVQSKIKSLPFTSIDCLSRFYFMCLCVCNHHVNVDEFVLIDKHLPFFSSIQYVVQLFDKIPLLGKHFQDWLFGRFFRGNCSFHSGCFSCLY